MNVLQMDKAGMHYHLEQKDNNLSYGHASKMDWVFEKADSIQENGSPLCPLHPNNFLNESKCSLRATTCKQLWLTHGLTSRDAVKKIPKASDVEYGTSHKRIRLL